MLALKVLMAPALIAAVTLAGRRWGHRIGGLITALPVVAGPTLAFYAIEQGSAFAAHAAHTSLLGLVGVAAFCLVYAHLCGSLPWSWSLAASIGAFVGVTALLQLADIGLAASLGLTATSLVGALALLPRPSTLAAPGSHSPWDLPLRMTAAAVVVVTLTSLAAWLGPRWSGLLASFPVATTIIASFTHAQHGPHPTVWFFRGLLPGLGGFALFCFVLGSSLGWMQVGLLAAATAALATQVSFQAVMVWLVARRPTRDHDVAPALEPR